MAAALKARERELAAAREAALRNEQILAIGTLAAGAAHQLGTPLGTMAIVIHELELTRADDVELTADLKLLRKQIDECKKSISQTLASAGQARDEDLPSMALDVYLQQLLEAWQIIRPRVPLRIVLDGPQPAPRIAAERTLEQAILNLLDNAADANVSHGESDAALQFTAHWDTDSCRIEILDHGPGLDAEAASRLGQPFFTTKHGAQNGVGGIGIGFFLTNATVERFGGRVELFNRDGQQGGACTRVTLPLARLKAAQL
jgi:two-component system sensor histidine kinase RegB